MKENLAASVNIRGTSGATITLLDGGVIKSGDPKTPIGKRVIDQGKYIQQLDVKLLPQVEAVNEAGGSYFMERLKPIPWALVDLNYVFMECVSHLFKDLWTHGYDRTVFLETLWVDRHWRYMVERCQEWVPDVLEKLEKEFENLDHSSLRMGTTHGDPTFDNCMLRHVGEDKGSLGNGYDLVIIDPLMPTPEMPNLVAVDIGKLFQSACGYENVLHRRKHENFSLMRALEILSLDDVERRAALYFCKCHFIRLLPYHNGPMRETFKNMLLKLMDFT